MNLMGGVRRDIFAEERTQSLQLLKERAGMPPT